MTAQRIKGQEVRLTFTGPTGQEDVGDIQSFEAELQMEILKEGYLGETVDRRDDIFRGVSGRCELHIENSKYFAFAQRVQDRAQRRSAAGGVFSATATFALPDGDRVRLTFENIFFGPLPLRVNDRAAYVQFTITWECEVLRKVF
jgi:hypothetical protein